MGRLPDNRDLLEAVEAVCRDEAVEAAVFHLTGTISGLTVGCYDATQQVWVTAQVPGPLEIVTCTGTVCRQEGDLKADARILVADTHGGLQGGRIFSETVAFAVEIDIEIFDGHGPSRNYDAGTGLWRLPLGPFAQGLRTGLEQEIPSTNEEAV